MAILGEIYPYDLLYFCHLCQYKVSFEVVDCDDVGSL